MPQNSQAPQNEGLLYLIPAIKSRINCLELIQQSLVPVERLNVRGNRATGLCPLHTEKTPSFVVFLDKDRWYCFGCHEHGDVIDLFAKYRGIGNKEAIRQLAVFLGISDNLTPRQRKKVEQAFKTRKLQALLNSAVQKEIDFVFDKLACLERGAEYCLLQVIDGGKDPLEDNIASWWLAHKDLVGFWLDCLSYGNAEERIAALEGAKAWII